MLLIVQLHFDLILKCKGNMTPGGTILVSAFAEMFLAGPSCFLCIMLTYNTNTNLANGMKFFISIWSNIATCQQMALRIVH